TPASTRADATPLFRILFDAPMISTMGRELRGWNGTLLVGDDRVVIKRGVRGRVVRSISSRRFGMHPQAVLRATSRSLNAARRARTTICGRSATHVRSPSRRARRWRRAAQEIAALSGVPLEAEPAAAYWRAVFGSLSSGRR